jgi:hypothetical protein
MPDLDQGGTFRETTRIYQGPSLGWSQGAAPPTAVASVTVAGTTVIQPGVSLVHVNVNGSVTIQLFRSKGNAAGAGQVPGSYLQPIVTINDIGGFAQANPITILPASGETISGSNSFIINSNYGLVSLLADVLNGGWTAINSVSGAALTDGPNDGFAYGRQSAAWARVVPLAGGTLTGPLATTSTVTLNADPAAALQAATKQYVDNTAVSVSGDTMTGLLVLSANPAAALGAATKQYVDAGIAGIAPPRSYLSGLGLSTAGASATFTVAAGAAVNSTNVDMMTLASPLSKTTGAWAVGSGNGALDTSVITFSTWYHVFLIKRTDTGVVDVLISQLPSAPTMPPNYTEWRRIGSMLTDISDKWVLFHQLGDEFLWDVPLNDVSTSTLTTTSTLFTVNVPTGVQVNALMRASMSSGTAGTGMLVQSPDESTQAVATPAGNVSMTAINNTTSFRAPLNIRTNTSAQIRAVASAASTTFQVNTYGWIDRRGRDA